MPLTRQYRRGWLEIGLDEAGRGCLAGPVTAAAVVLAPGRRSPADLNDSKALSPARREALRCWIEANSLAWAVGWASPLEIDTENILQASMTAMHRALDQVMEQLEPIANPENRMVAAGPQFVETQQILTAAKEKDTKPLCLLVDGNYFRPYREVVHSCQVKGDGRFQAIAAASILAKTYRDARMQELHAEFPGYGWSTNQGYPTPPHRRAIAELGICAWHRRSFRMKS